MTSVSIQIKRGLAETPAGHVHYRVAGAGEPLLLLHQNYRSTDEYLEMLPILARKTRAIAMDTMGYGDSDKPPRPLSMAEFAQTVVMLLDALGISKTNLVGHHTGAYIATEVAAAYPERVDKLVLSGAFNMDAAERERQAGKYQQWQPKADGSHLREMWDRAAKTTSVDMAQRRVLDMLKCGETSEYGHWAVMKYPQEERLPLIQSPTLLVWGTAGLHMLDSRGWRASENRHKVEQAVRRRKTVVIPDGTWWLPNEKPELFARLILEFLENPGV